MTLPNDARDAETGDDAALARALAETPRGTIALAGGAVLLLLLAWLAIYLMIFLPRGPVS